MNVLIPTDFSKSSKIAIEYIIDISRDIELNIVLLHVLDTSDPKAILNIKKLEDAVKISTTEEMKEFVSCLKEENNSCPNIKYKIVNDYAIADAVEKHAIYNAIDLICIGTKGARGLKKIILGSNAVAIIKNSSIPVLTIPEYARYKGIDNFLYSSDLFNLEKELETIIPFAKILESSIHILHIEEENEDSNIKYINDEKRLRKLFSYKKISMNILKNISVIEGINQQIKEIDAGLLILFTHSTTLLEKIFQQSITQNIAFQTKTPLLSFQKKIKSFI